MRSRLQVHKSPLILILVMITVILTVMQFTTLERVKQVFLEDRGMAGGISDLFSTISAVDILLISVLAIMALLAAWLEIRGRRISSDFSTLLESENGTLAILLVLAILSARYYLAPGEITLGDSSCHMSRVYAAAESLSSGSWPTWSFYNYCGFPLLRFYAPGFFILTGTLSLLTGSPEWAVKVILFLFHAGSAFPVYFWARTIGASRASALLSGAIIALSFVHTHTVVWTGALPVSAVFVLYPLIFLSIEKLLQGGGGRWVAILSLATASMVLFHHGYAAYGLTLAALYLVLRMYISGKESPPVRLFARTVLAIAGGLLLCAFFLYPVLTEGKWVFLPEGEWRLRPSIPGLAFLKSLLVWRNIWSGWTVAYIGVSTFVFFLAGGIRSFRIKGRGSVPGLRAAVIMALFALSCAAGRGRVINLALPFIAIVAGTAAIYPRRESTARASLLMLVILLVDLGPTTVQSPYRTDRSFTNAGLRNAGETVSPGRIIAGYNDGSRWAYPEWGYTEGTGVFQPTGFFPQGAPRMINTVTGILDNLNACGDSLDASMMDQLYLLNVKALVMRTRERYMEPVPSGSPGPASNPPLSWILPASPLVYSAKAVALPPDSLTAIQESGLLMELSLTDPNRRSYGSLAASAVRNMKIDRDGAVAERLYLWPGQHAGTPTVQGGEDIEGKPLQVMQYEASLDMAKIRFDQARPGWVRASFSWYPSMTARLDGDEIHVYRSILGACLIQTPAGEHTLEIMPGRSSPVPGILGLILGLIILGISLRTGSQIRPDFSK